MELLGTLGLYLILAFVLPGLCYLLAFGLAFPDAFKAVQKWLPPEGEDTAQGIWLFLFAVTGGLLLTSVTFSLEIVLRHSLGFFKRWYPAINFAVRHPPDSYATILIPSSIMHFNIGFGILLILVTYLIYALWQRKWTRKESWLASGLMVLVVANMIVAGEIYRRVRELPVELSITVPPPSH